MSEADNRMFCYGCNRWRERVAGWDRGKCPTCRAKKVAQAPLYDDKGQKLATPEPYVYLYDNAGNLIKQPKKKAPHRCNGWGLEHYCKGNEMNHEPLDSLALTRARGGGGHKMQQSSGEADHER